MVARSVATLAALSLPTWLPGQTSTSNRRIAVTIDDGPVTPPGSDLETFLRIGNALRETFVAEKVPASMFVNERGLHVDGQRDERVEMVTRWLDAGLDLGNHTFSHWNLGEVPLQRYLDDIIKGEVVSRSLLDARKRPLTWFRYPFLATGQGNTAIGVEEFLAARGYRIAPVSAVPRRPG